MAEGEKRFGWPLDCGVIRPESLAAGGVASSRIVSSMLVNTENRPRHYWLKYMAYRME